MKVNIIQHMFYDPELSGVIQPKTGWHCFTYDGNGNMTGNPANGVGHIEWSETGKPLRVSFSSGEEIRYRYAATGGKLSEEFADADGTTLRRRDIYGSHEFTDGSLDRIQVEGGYLDTGGDYHVYVNDYWGNVIGVVNAYCAADPVNFIDPTGEVIIFVNGLDKFGAKPAGEEYWTQCLTN